MPTSYYNEAPPIGIYPTDPIVPVSPVEKTTVPSGSPVGPSVTNAMILIGDRPVGSDTSQLTIRGRHRVYVLGDLPVTVTDNSSVHINSARANVTVTGSARANIEQGTLIARDRAVVNGKGDITCYDSTTIYVAGGVLHDKGHLDIIAYNDAVINSFTSRRIKLNDQARLVIE